MTNVDEKFLISFGERVKTRRKEIKMSQETLAAKVGYEHKTSISKIEHGKTSVPQNKVFEIANALDTTIQYLMGRTDEVQKETFKDKREKFLEHEALISAWEKATDKERYLIYNILKEYGMPEPIQQEGRSSESSFTSKVG